MRVRPLLTICALAAGAAVMALEIAAGRALAPGFGSSIYVWSAVISVTLLFLALGYGVGGRAADRWPSASTLGVPLLLAAATGTGCFWLNRAFADVLVEFDVRLGALISAAVLLALPLACAAAVSPICIRLATHSSERVGTAAGTIYAASTVGGVVATLLAGFWTIPAFGVTATFHGACALLALSALVVFGIGRRRIAAVVSLLVLLLTAMLATRGDAVQATGAVLMSRQSPYGHVVVTESLGQRLLFVDGVLQTGAPVYADEITARSHIIEERYHLELLPHFRPQARKALLIGGGGGLFSKVMAGYGVETLGVEIDPVVAEAALVYFTNGVGPGDPTYNGSVVIEDGRRFLRRTDERFDFIVIDAYSGEVPPAHLFTREAFELAAARLSPDGIVAINLIADPDSAVPRAVWATLAPILRHQRAYRFQPAPGTQPLTFFASDEPLELDRECLQSRCGLPADDVLDELRSAELAFDLAGAPIITDDHNPIELAWHRDVLAWRRDMRAFVR
jgi:predicted membrane-bound spermidine synthase